MDKGRIIAICTSEERGTKKKPMDAPAHLIADWGIEHDAHAGKWHRQISLLGHEAIEAFRARGAEVASGAFGENIIIEGLDFQRLAVGAQILLGEEAVLEVTQIGKECHNHCVIYQAVGDCIMPREGVFAKVLRGGWVSPGDAVSVTPPDRERPFTAAVITLSDKGASGEREDLSGPAITEMLTAAGYEITETLLLPDGIQPLASQLERLADQRQVDLILTTGGTGFSDRDLTPEATLQVCDRMASGIAEAIRAYSTTITPRAMLSRAVSGIRKRTLIINLPGSPKAVRESLDYILPTLAHGLDILRGTGGECAC